MQPMYNEGNPIPTYGSYDSSEVKSVSRSSMQLNKMNTDLNTLQENQNKMNKTYASEIKILKEAICEYDDTHPFCD